MFIMLTSCAMRINNRSRACTDPTLDHRARIGAMRRVEKTSQLAFQFFAFFSLPFSCSCVFVDIVPVVLEGLTLFSFYFKVSFSGSFCVFHVCFVSSAMSRVRCSRSKRIQIDSRAHTRETTESDGRKGRKATAKREEAELGRIIQNARLSISL